MSGTGNTLRMGCWMKEMAEERGCRAEVVMIEDADPAAGREGSPELLTGFLFPTHGFMPPWSMIKFLFKTPGGSGAPAICAATRGAFRLGPLFVPGAAGLAAFIAAMILFFKGRRVRGVFSLDMPANMLNFHSGLSPENVEWIHGRARRKLSRIMSRVLNGDKLFFTLNNLYEVLVGVPIIVLFPLFPVAYLLIGRFFMGKLMFSNNRCIGCGLCVRSCPNKGVVFKKAGKRKRPYWTFHCEVCLRCMGYCPKQAVEAGHSWAVVAYFITAVPVVTWLLSWLHGVYPVIPVPDDYWVRELLNVAYLYPALIISYWMFWRLIRIPAVNSIFTFTTLTHYYRRYHAPGIKVTHMTRRVPHSREFGTWLFPPGP
ncbi:MAG: 4Fe-4S dicluster domain-containing protein [Desulfobacterales bacterium]|nr:4Fe-4S dicluster domain-containing protein [Desulfobacterales bacterium]